MDNNRFIHILELYKKNVPWYAQQKLSHYTSRRNQLAEEYKQAKDKNDAGRMKEITQEGLEVKEYIQALT